LPFGAGFLKDLRHMLEIDAGLLPNNCKMQFALLFGIIFLFLPIPIRKKAPHGITAGAKKMILFLSESVLRTFDRLYSADALISETRVNRYR